MTNKILRGDSSQLSGIKSVTYREQVNSDTDLRPGCVSSASIEVEVIGTQSGSVTAGEALTYYQVDENGVETLIGVFYAEPTIKSRSTYKFTAYDSVSKLDRDFSTRLSEIQSNFPMTLSALIGEVCAIAGVTLTGTVPMGSTQIHAFYSDGITCRQVMSWAAEIACRFVRCDTSGNIKFDWYSTVNDYRIYYTDGSENDETYIYYKQNGLNYENYTTAGIDRVVVRPTDEAGTEYIYPNGVSTGNTLQITNNLLLAGLTDSTYSSIAQNIYTTMYSIGTYRPSQISLFPFNNPFRAGDIVKVTDVQGVSFVTPVMSMTVNSESAQIISTGGEKYSDTSSSVSDALVSLSDSIVRLRKLKVDWAEIETAVIDALEVTGIDASQINVTNLNANNINIGTIDPDRVDIQIGGTNLLQETQLNTDWMVDTGISKAIDSTGFAVISQSGTSSEWYCVSSQPSVDWGQMDGQSVVLSFDYKATDALTAVIVFCGFAGASGTTTMDRTKWHDHYIELPAASDWARYSLTVDELTASYLDSGSGNVNSFGVWLYNRTDNSTLQTRRWKLELGNKATDWSPAPEDVQKDISAAQAIATGKSTTYVQASQPTGGAYRVNDVWYDTSNDNAVYVYDGSSWVKHEFGTVAIENGAITADKINVSELAALGATIGGFTIEQTNIRNGMTSLGDTTNNGVYVGTDGIALGAGKFKATSDGTVSITGTIYSYDEDLTNQYATFHRWAKLTGGLLVFYDESVNMFTPMAGYIGMRPGENVVATDNYFHINSGQETYGIKFGHWTNLGTEPILTLSDLNGATFHTGVTFANNTLNLIGDDCYLGDQNIAGSVALQGLTGTNTGIAMLPNVNSSGDTMWMEWSGSALTFKGGATNTDIKLGQASTVRLREIYDSASSIRGNIQILHYSTGNALVNIYANGAASEIDLNNSSGNRRASLYISASDDGCLQLRDAYGSAATLTYPRLYNLISLSGSYYDSNNGNYVIGLCDHAGNAIYYLLVNPSGMSCNNATWTQTYWSI